MKTALTYARITLGFLSGGGALAVTFILALTIAVRQSHSPHGSPSMNDFWFGVAALAAVTLGFVVGAASLGRSGLQRLPTRRAAIAGVGAVAVLLITMILFGESLRERGSIVAAFTTGVLAAGVLIWSRRTRSSFGSVAC